MEPQIRYCTTSDGVRIAYTTIGDGPGLILLSDSPAQFSIWFERTTEFIRSFTAHRRLIFLDGRGIGLSQRNLDDYSLKTRLLDLEAVVNACDLDRFDVIGRLFSGPVAVAYAAFHPTRVGHLILIGTYARASDVTPWERMAPIVELARTNWKLAYQVLRGIAADSAIEDRKIRTLYEETMDGPDAARWLTDQYQVDVRETAGSLAVPTLVIHSRHDRAARFALGQDLASRIPGARFLPVEHNDFYWSRHGWGIIEAFLSDSPDPADMDWGTTSRATDAGTKPEPVIRAVLFTDLVGHTEMMQRLGDAKGREVLREHERITRETLRYHGGVEVKTMGDGFLASFASVTSAMECAIALQQAFAAWNEDDGARQAAPLRVRVGLNAGEPIEEDGDLFGSTVILASRIAARAEAGEILVPDTVRGLLSGKGFILADRGEFLPKGFDDAVRLFEVRWREGD